MGRFFLFAILTWITGSPLLAIVILIARRFRVGSQALRGPPCSF